MSYSHKSTQTMIALLIITFGGYVATVAFEYLFATLVFGACWPT